MSNLFPFTMLGKASSSFHFWAVACQLAVVNAFLIVIYTAAVCLTVKAIF